MPNTNTIYLVMKVEHGRCSLTGVATDPKQTIAEVMESAIEAMAEQIGAEGYEAELERAARTQGSDPQPKETEEQAPEPAPICAIHQVPMVWQQGRKGSFWSCHEWDPKTGYCTYRPPKAA